jgi:hypothetical protein
MEERQHHLNKSSSARLRRSQKLEILPSPNSKSLGAYFLGAYIFVRREDFNGHLVTTVYYEAQTFLMWCRYFMYAQIFWIGVNISWARIFHGCEYFMGANISWARIFHRRKYFTCKSDIYQLGLEKGLKCS